MSELKAISSGEIYNIIEYEGSCITDDLYYPKSEADKVIAELKHDVENWIGSYEASRRVNAISESKLRHSNYKRCLDKAKLCKLKRIDAADYRIPRKKWEFYDKWLDRWLELAEKFKHNQRR